jgi:hypothetical protein
MRHVIRDFRSFSTRIQSFSFLFIIPLLLMLLTASCSEDSNPVAPKKDDSDCIDYRDYLQHKVCDS